MRRTNLSTLLTLAFWLSALPTAQATDKMYWTDDATNKIQRANLEIPPGETPSTRTDIEDLVIISRPAGPLGIALDVAHGKMYWTNFDGLENSPQNKIQRANLDGSNVEDLVSNLPSPDDIALDVDNGLMYWTDFASHKIQRANLEIPPGETPSTRTDIEDLLTGIGDPRGLALDVAHGKMYWTENALQSSLSDKIRRANLEIPPGETPSTRTDIENLVTFPRETPTHLPIRIALDLVHGKMYWTLFSSAFGSIPRQRIQRANLDGSNVEDLVVTAFADTQTTFQAIALDVTSGKMYWTMVNDTSLGISKIQRANLDGSNIEDSVTKVLRDPRGIALQLDASVQVTIDIKPGEFPNSINPRSNGVIPIAILTTATFDATTVDPTTVLFGATGTEAAAVNSALQDVDGDGDTDLLLLFNTQATDIHCGDTSASLTGETFSKQAIEGADGIRTVGCK